MINIVKLENICKQIVDCPHSTPAWQDKGFIIVRNYNIRKGELDLTNASFVDEETYKSRIKRAIPEENDLIISREAPMGEVCIIPKDIKCCLGQRVVLLKVDKEKCNPQFLVYAIISNFVQKQISVVDKTGSIVSNLNIQDLKNILIPIFERDDQDKIVLVLSSISRKITINKQINILLEKLAKTLFNYWFVQFDFPNANGKPYRASGGKMEYSEVLKREIPKGWEVKSLGDMYNVSKGSLITEKEAKSGNVKVVAAGINFSYFHSEANRPENTITISASGANAGYVNFWREKIFASDCITVRGDDDLDSYLVYLFLDFMQNTILKKATGSAQPHVYPDDIKQLYLCKIPQSLKDNIRNLLFPLNKKIANVQKEIAKLIELRDFLLPLLMNGQVRVGDV